MIQSGISRLDEESMADVSILNLAKIASTVTGVSSGYRRNPFVEVDYAR